jgi:hypothetical protein
MQYGLFTVDDQRVPRIVATLEPRNGGRPVGEKIDNFSLAFVAPLGADDNNILTHA